MIYTVVAFKHLRELLRGSVHNRSRQRKEDAERRKDAPARFVMSPISHTVKNAIEIPSALPVV